MDLGTVIREHVWEGELTDAVEEDRVGALVGSTRGVHAANGYYRDQIGYSAEEVAQGVSWLKLTPVQWVQADLRGISEARAVGVCAPYVKEYARRDSTIRRLEICLKAIDDDFLLGLTANAGDTYALAAIRGFSKAQQAA